MVEASCRRCGVTIETETDAHYQRVAPDAAPVSPKTLYFCSPRCVYEYTGEHA